MAARNTVKIDRVLLIAELEKALVKSNKEFKVEQDQAQADHKKYLADKASYYKSLIAFIKKNIVEIEDERRYYGNAKKVCTFSVTTDETFDLTTCPKYVNEPQKGLTNHVAEKIEQALKVLRLSTEDSVGASFYDSVLNYI